MIRSQSFPFAVAVMGASVFLFSATLGARADEPSSVQSDSVQSGSVLLSGSIRKQTSYGQPLQWTVSIKNLTATTLEIGHAGEAPLKVCLVDRITGDEVKLSTRGNFFWGDNIQNFSFGFERLKPGDEKAWTANLCDFFESIPPGSYELRAYRNDGHGDVSKSRSTLTLLFEVTR